MKKNEQLNIMIGNRNKLKEIKEENANTEW